MRKDHTSEAIAALKNARLLIHDRESWCQGEAALNLEGRRRHPMDRDACKWCLTGALRCGGIGHADATAALENELREGGFLVGNVLTIADWNDQPGRKHAEVLALIDKGIQRLGGTP